MEMSERNSVSSSSSSYSCWKHDVFLSFRGEDTGNNIASHLYRALWQKGMVTYKNDQKLERGKPISELLEAIRDSRFVIIIFSKNYASSEWCLEEMAKAYECMKIGRLTVLPVYCQVDPSEVSQQRGEYGVAFSRHENLHKDKAETWRNVMTSLADFSGWHLQHRNEAEFIDEIVEYISRRLSGLTRISKGLYGIDNNVKEIISYLNPGIQDDVRMVGICGMGGIGKTTIANVVYEKMAPQFEGSSFLANVREAEAQKNGLVILQEQLLCETLTEKGMKVWNTHNGANVIRRRLRRKRILVVVDDINCLDKLESLVGFPCWFGNGSRVIITTRDEQLLNKMDKIFRIEGLNHDDAFELFCSKAFKGGLLPHDDYIQLLNRAVEYAGGLPLALCVLGAFFCGRSLKEWGSALDRLGEISDKEVKGKLEISFDGLEETDKEIFLDIACFFKGQEEDYVMQVLECCGLYPAYGVQVLKDKSLISISNNKVWMHDLLQEMGQEIVRRESGQEPGTWSRLWLYEDFYHVFLNDTGTKQVEGIVLDSYEQETVFSAKSFSKMKKLRLLKVENICLCDDLEYLSHELRYLAWHGYPYNSFPDAFQPLKLVELHMPHSNIQQLWEGIKPLESLKIIDLGHSQNLIKTPNFLEVPNLEKLNLEGCIKLTEVHQSIGVLQNLAVLNLKDCQSIVGLPLISICKLKSLEMLIVPQVISDDLLGTMEIDSLSNKMRHLVWHKYPYATLPSTFQPKDLLQLHLPFSSIVQLWKDKQHLALLRIIDLRFSRNLIEITPSFEGWTHLEKLNLEGCERLSEIHHSIGDVSNLKELNLSATCIVTIPETISRLSRLQSLLFTNCKKLGSLPKFPSSVAYLSMDGCDSLQAFPIPFEKCISKPLLLSFVNCFKLDDHQGAFAWVKHHLHFLSNNLPQGLFDSYFRFSICYPGNRIPTVWFNYQDVGSSMEIQLGPDWCKDEWMGFSACGIFQIDRVPMVTSNLACQVHAFAERDEDQVSLGSSGTHFSKVYAMSDQTWINFIPRENVMSLNDLNRLIRLKVSFSCYGLKVKHCGFRLVYKQDIPLLEFIRKRKRQND